MKKPIKSIAAAALLVAALVTVVLAKANSTQELDNNSSYGLGWVNIHCTDNSTAHVNVSAPGVYYPNVSASPDAVIINGYATYWGAVRNNVVTTGGDIVKVDLTTNIIIVTHQQGG